MKIFLADTSFPLSKQDNAGMSVKCVAWQLQKNGIELVSQPHNADLIFLSSVHPLTAPYAERLKSYKIPIVFGGFGALSPSIYLNFCDFVVLGDGDRVFKEMAKGGHFEDLPNVLTKGKASVDIDQNFPFDCPPIQQEDGSYSVWCGRGCKNKCFFCQTGWALMYKENPVPPIYIANGLLKQGKKISYLSNDLLQHTFYSSLPNVMHGSYSIKFLKKNGLPPARLIRIGVEGVSQRLRTLVNKPIMTDDLVKCSSWLNQNKKGVRWFLIAGLPTEQASDWEELKDAVMFWKKITPKGVLELSFTAWCPDPATPLAIMPLNDQYYEHFLSFKEWFFSGIGFSNKIKLYSPQAPEKRLEKAIFSMNLEKEQLYSGGYWGGNDVVNYPYKKQVREFSQKIYLN